MDKNIVLICKPLRFYTENDEALFFGWLEKITCIEQIKGIGKKLHLFIALQHIPNNDLLDLIGLFSRYKFDIKQLRVFMNEDNKEWFDE
jgi:hypothetical protein